MVKWSIGSFIVALVCVLAWMKITSGVHVNVTNVGDTALENVVVEVTGGKFEIGTVEAGATESIKVHATGESHVRLRWESGGKKGFGRVDCYFEGDDYHGDVDVEIEGEIMKSSKAELDPGVF